MDQQTGLAPDLKEVDSENLQREGQNSHDEGSHAVVDYNPTVSREGEDKRKDDADSSSGDGK